MSANATNAGYVTSDAWKCCQCGTKNLRTLHVACPPCRHRKCSNCTDTVLKQNSNSRRQDKVVPRSQHGLQQAQPDFQSATLQQPRLMPIFQCIMGSVMDRLKSWKWQDLDGMVVF
ncbi:uncharacterized protein PV07_07221 [Cladophialophora immunda]|uniref:Uncharacterized protein n=1 Tax=Cladophialophora immunda TaxID=569365 RepID=A0A0D2C8U5_9EURO|nr:uncharacterized protein PV07_07221 [Cladophialophora immunda]KIW27488.1 hypothetical protein PV07_07221 [Cladophialophora immunda]